MKKPQQLDIATPLLKWFDVHGRHDLPWQKNINAYRVWISEVMLQQTQVATVIPFYQRFMAEFPTIQQLAAAPQDQVLHLWTGLGYYSRARNLHKTAQIICTEFAGEFPQTVEELTELPGIGRSTAGAIAAIAYQQHATILDGNVKRVLARVHAIEGYPGDALVAKKMWALAETHTPKKRVADYTQAIMDLGASLCSRSKPDCQNCPLQTLCLGTKHGNPTIYPGKKPKKSLPVKQTQWLIIENPHGEILLQQRPPSGLWGGLWIFPELSADQTTDLFCLTQLGQKPIKIDVLASFRHTFSHFHLDISPIKVQLGQLDLRVLESYQALWYKLDQPAAIGLAAPVLQLLNALKTTSSVTAII
jgi:A/G-specific adenine glycosylase